MIEYLIDEEFSSSGPLPDEPLNETFDEWQYRHGYLSHLEEVKLDPLPRRSRPDYWWKYWFERQWIHNTKDGIRWQELLGIIQGMNELYPRLLYARYANSSEKRRVLADHANEVIRLSKELEALELAKSVWRYPNLP